MSFNIASVLGRGARTTPGGSSPIGGPSSSTDKALVRWNGTTGKLVQNGVVVEADNSGNLTGATDQSTTSAVGSAFTNQPSNDSVTFSSSNAADTTQTITIIGTTTGGNVVVAETDTLTGTTPVISTKVNWGKILAIKLSASCAGTVTVTKTSGAGTIVAITTTNLSAGVNTVSAANQAAYNQKLSTVASGATTKQVGWGGTDTTGAQIYDSFPLNGTAAVASNSNFYTLTEIYTGDVENTRTVTVTTNGGWTLTGGGGGILNFVTGGAVTMSAGGTNQSITLTPSGTGHAIVSTSGNMDYLQLTDSTRTLAFGFTSTNAYITTVNNYALAFAVGNTEKMRLAVTTGNLLLGLTSDVAGSLQTAGKIGVYNNVTTAGWGVPAIQASANVTAQNAANSSIATYTVGAADGDFRVSAQMSVTASTTLATTLTCTYTDVANVARSMILPVVAVSGTFVAAGAITGAGASIWETPTMNIRCKASTAITILTSAGTFSGVTYSASGTITQVS